jgi:hypothetical protein
MHFYMHRLRVQAFDVVLLTAWLHQPRFSI